MIIILFNIIIVCSKMLYIIKLIAYVIYVFYVINLIL